MSYKVLLIDADTEAGARFRRSLLEAGHQLIKAGDARKATETLEKIRPDVALVIEDSGHLAAGALCAHLTKTRRGRVTPFVFLAVDLPGDADELNRRTAQVGCDRMLSRSVSMEQLLEVCEQLIRSKSAAAPATASIAAGAYPAAASATGKTDPGNTHPVIGAVGPVARPASGTAPVRLATDKETNRDAGSPEFFSTTLAAEPPGTAPGADDIGRDIEAHLDSLFGSERATQPAKREPPPPKVEPAAQPMARPAPPARPAPAKPSPRPMAEAQRSAVTASATPAPTAPARPEARARPVAPPQTVKPKPGPPAPPTPQAAPAPQQAPSRETPKAVEQLRLPRVAETQATVVRSYRRWLPVAAGIGAATVVIALLATVYFVFMRGDSSRTEPPAIAQARPTAEPLPMPPPLESAPSAATAPFPVEPPEAPADPAQEPVDAPRGTGAEEPTPETAAKTTEKVAASVPPAKPATATPKPSATVPKTTSVATPRPAPKPAPKPDPPVKTASAAEKTAPAEKLVETAAATPPPRATRPEPSSTAASADASGALITAGPAAPEPPAQEASAPPPERIPQPEPPAAEEPAAAAPEAAEVRPAQPSEALLPADEPAVDEPTTSPRPGFRPPIVVERVEPEYSPKAARGVDKAVVVLRVLLDEKGKIVRVNVEQGIPGSELESAAINAIMRWRFHPATEFGAPVRAWTTARFVFEP